MRYIDIGMCVAYIFPLIRQESLKPDSVPDYEKDTKGLAHLEGILHLMQREEYEDVLEKAAYMFCSILNGHPFGNGNKRLATTLLAYFLLLNDRRFLEPGMDALFHEFQKAFPQLQLEDKPVFRHSHDYFFYHLGKSISDRSQKEGMNFQQEQKAVQTLLRFITRGQYTS